MGWRRTRCGGVVGCRTFMVPCCPAGLNRHWLEGYIQLHPTAPPSKHTPRTTPHTLLYLRRPCAAQQHHVSPDAPAP